MDYYSNVRNAPIHHSEKVVSLHVTAQKRGVTMWLGVLYPNMTKVLAIVIYIMHVAAGGGIHPFLKFTPWKENIDQILRYGLERTPAPPSSTTTGLYIEDWQIGRLPLSHFKIRCCVPDNTAFVVGIVGFFLNIMITYHLL